MFALPVPDIDAETLEARRRPRLHHLAGAVAQAENGTFAGVEQGNGVDRPFRNVAAARPSRYGFAGDAKDAGKGSFPARAEQDQAGLGEVVGFGKRDAMVTVG